MMQLKEPNPLNILTERRLAFLPEFFETINIERKYNLDETIAKWIEQNLKGRYFVGHRVVLGSTGVENKLTIGFENTKELSYFTLACPLLKY